MAASSSSTPDKCPVDHSSLPPTAKGASDACPVDHTTRSTWDRFLSPDRARRPDAEVSLSTEREVSSIPKPNDSNWVYPSEAQFFAAMARKNHNPQAADMKTIIPIHNAVNERAWSEILKWERGKGGDACGGVQLVNFKGRPNDRSPKARLNELLGLVTVSLWTRRVLIYLTGTLHLSTAMTGSWTGAGRVCDTLLTSTLDRRHPKGTTFHSILMYVPR